MHRWIGQTLSCAIVLAGTLASYGCQGGGGGIAPEADDNIGFTILSDTTLDGGSYGAVDPTLARNGEQLVVTINATAAAGLKALYGQLTYDPAKWDSGVLVPGEFWGAPAGVLSLAVEHGSGVIEVGCVLTNWDQRAGVTGDGSLAIVTFSPAGNSTSHAPRQAAGPDVMTSALWIERPAGELTWMSRLEGDYNDDNLVSITDLTPLGANYGTVFQADQNIYLLPYLPSSAALCDGNKDASIDELDAATIALHYGNSITGFRIYRSSDWWRDYPRPDFDAPQLQAYAEIPYSERQSGAPDERPFFSVAVDETDPYGQYWWVVPYKDSWRGSPSNSAVETGVALPRYDYTCGLTYDPQSATLSWFHNLLGDYNQDGAVSINDVTPTAAYSGRPSIPIQERDPLDTIPSIAPDWLCDGLRDGIIDGYDFMAIQGDPKSPFSQWLKGYQVFVVGSMDELPSDPLAAPAISPFADYRYPTSWTEIEDFTENGWICELNVEIPSGSLVWIQPYTNIPSEQYGPMSEVIQVP